MEANLFEHNKKLKAQKTITILIIISLILTTICSLTVFTYFTSSGNEGVWEFHFSLFRKGIVGAVFSLLEYFISVAPILLFATYIFKYYKRFLAAGTLPIVLVLIAFDPLLSFIGNFALGYGFPTVLDLLVNILIVVSFTLAAVNSLKGLSKKVYIVVAISCGLLGEAISFISFIRAAGVHISEGLYLYLFTWPLSIIGISALYIAILLFALKNNIPATKKEEKSTDKMSPEQSLRYLKERLDLGMITEEEYQAQRAEIISKL